MYVCMYVQYPSILDSRNAMKWFCMLMMSSYIIGSIFFNMTIYIFFITYIHTYIHTAYANMFQEKSDQSESIATNLQSEWVEVGIGAVHNITYIYTYIHTYIQLLIFSDYFDSFGPNPNPNPGPLKVLRSKEGDEANRGGRLVMRREDKKGGLGTR